MTWSILIMFLSLTLNQAAEARPLKVDGLLATRVRFQGAAAEKIAEAGLALLKSCHYSHSPNEGEMPEWDDTLLEVSRGSVTFTSA